MQEAQGRLPLIVTAQMGTSDFRWADGLRRTHFPPDRNRLSAHITLFHHLPPSVLTELVQRVKGLCAGPPPEARISGLMNLGRGVAFRVESPELMAMRADLADAFAGMLTPQDQAKPRLHITVQNKVSGAEVKALFDALSLDFQPRPLKIAGLAVWFYCGGPWRLVRDVRFRG